MKSYEKKNKALLSSIEYKESNAGTNIHFHADYELMLITAGSIEIEINNETYVAEEGMMIWMNNAVNHKTTVRRNPYKRYIVTLDTEGFDWVTSDIIKISILKSVNFRTIVLDDLAPYKQIFENILRETQGETQLYADILIETYIRQLMIYICRNLKDPDYATDKYINQVIWETTQYIKEHFAEKIVIANLCKAQNIDVYYFTHQFTSVVGCSPKRFLIQVRLNAAGLYLADAKWTVGAISEKTGFSDVNNFIRTFKRYFGMTPNVYRKKYL